MKNLAKSAPPLRFNIHVPSSRNVLLFSTPSFFLLFYALILLLISPSALTLSDLYFRNTSPGQKQYSNTSPHRFVVVGFLVPLTQFIFVFSNTSPDHKLLYRTSLCSNVAGKARPLSVIHGIMSTILLCIRTLYILLIFSNSLDDADEWHRSHSMH